MPKHLSFSIVGAPGAQQVLLIGTIDSNMATLFRKTLDADPSIRTVMVDSYGGNIDSAMDMATLIWRPRLGILLNDD